VGSGSAPRYALVDPVDIGGTQIRSVRWRERYLNRAVFAVDLGVVRSVIVAAT
jgi:hypothetical protein